MNKFSILISNIKNQNPIVERWREALDIKLINPLVLNATKNIIDVLDWVCKLYNKNKDYKKAVALTCLYDVLICEFLKIIVQELEHIEYRLNRAGSTSLATFIQKRKKEFRGHRIFKKYDFWRNKVFAHTSWSSPYYKQKKIDIPSTRITSLMQWAVPSVAIEGENISLGQTFYSGNFHEIFYRNRSGIITKRRIYINLRRGDTKFLKEVNISKDNYIIKQHIKDDVILGFEFLLKNFNKKISPK